MSDDILAVLISVGILFALFVWVPSLHFCDGCIKKIARRRTSAASLPLGQQGEVSPDEQVVA